jgi:oligoendopeptidase F
MSALPQWDLASIYPSFEDEKFTRDREALAGDAGEIVRLLAEPPRLGPEEPAWLERYLSLYNSFADRFETMYAYAYMRYSTNTGDYTAIGEMNRLEGLRVPVQRAIVEFRNVLASFKTSIAECLQAAPGLKEYSFFIEEQLSLRSRQMGPAEEELALELTRMGGDPWGRLQEALSSTLKAVWNEKKGETKTVNELRSLAFDPRRAVRKQAFELELKLWDSMKVPLAFSLNGVKGFTVVLDKKRKYKNPLDHSLTYSRLSPAALEALIGVMKRSLPDFRRYLKAKATMLSLPQLAFFDLFAPLSAGAGEWSYAEARAFIGRAFGSFSTELADFADRAFDSGWIDARTRPGKVGGAYCISLPRLGESRVLCNFTPSFNQLTTIAHELGHAFHHQVLARATAIQRDYPMTLAETASIFSENLVYETAINTFTGARKIEALEHFLQDATQIIVDILSRFLFESRLFEARPSGEVSADELSAFMIQAQADTYGDALAEESLHPYMWAVKGHYYRPDLSFYNYPYAFGLLFGLGLFSLYREQGRGFADTYKTVLGKSGSMKCVDLTRELGFDIEQPEFWENGMSLIRSRIDEFCALAESAGTKHAKRNKPRMNADRREKGKTGKKKPASKAAQDKKKPQAKKAKRT